MPLTNPYPYVDTDVISARDYGLLTWNWAPHGATTNVTTRFSTAGRVHGFRTPIPYPMSITNIHLYIAGTPTSLSSTSCGVALYGGTGALIGSLVGSSVSTAWGTTGFKTHALTGGPFQVPAGQVVVAAWWAGTTAPALLTNLIGTDINLGVGANVNLRQFLANTSTTTSAPANLSNFASSGAIPFWVGLS